MDSTTSSGGSYDELLLGAVIALFVIVVTTALVYRSNTHVGDIIDSDGSKGGSAAVEDTAHNEGVVADTEDEPVEDGSCVPVADHGNEACANCGKHGSDSVKLKNCNACLLVKYCGVDCQKAHWKQHKKACKKRAAKLKDEQLYNQGLERPEGDFCPICTLPIPLPMDEHSLFRACCMKRVCKGCHLAAKKRGMRDCAFCRTTAGNDADDLAMIQARAAKKDPEAILCLGQTYNHGNLGLQKDARKAVELYTEASELGSIQALSSLGYAYLYGDGVQQDKAKAVEFFAKAALQGHAESRYKLGCDEGRKGNFDRATRHFLISAKMGHMDSLEMVKNAFMSGFATKEQYTQALKGYQVAVEETKSHDRDEARRLGY
ncbi:hypothetical protein THAOC_05123 [Thalassiosira oceanica]|uniref:MYND-type domain-containing protein n=1 Tax=Thalassiosira oceanica TaxID=159749 RepID=K0T3L9_THAOC|nr:hypothetical protein THAOC_05123 [Thalassiosira oceanica]|eukprot:EJK73263.1 hypothetical protein THAOC_05123 [Thalassiosira oceanica]